jgi:hypothetical protein
MERFDPAAIRPAVATFDYSRRVAFAAYWAERLLPMHQAFASASGDRNASFVRECVITAWDVARGMLRSPREIEDMQTTIVDVSPEIDRPPVLAAAAMEATSATWDCLDVVATGSDESATGAAMSASRVIGVLLMNRDHRGEVLFDDGSDALGLEGDELYLNEVAALNVVLDVLRSSAPFGEAVEHLQRQARVGDGGRLLREIVDLSRTL